MTVIDPADFVRLFDPEVRSDPYPVYAQLCATGPARLGTAPVVVFSSYADCLAILRDPRTSSNRERGAVSVNRLHAQAADRPSGIRSSFLFLDPPDHTRLRRLVSGAFTPRKVEGLATRIEELIDASIDRVAETGSMDVVSDLAYPLPVQMICELLGVPLDDEPQFSRWSHVLARSLDPITAAADTERELAAVATAEDELFTYFERLIKERRANPGDDLLSALIQVEDAGDSLSHEELIATCGLLLVAGHETTVNLIANGVLALLRHPSVLENLSRDPSFASAVVEETLRYDPPVQLMPRIATEAIDWGPLRIEAGDVLVLLLAAAHRDQSITADPDRFDPHRDVKHLAFGMGAHFCLGAPLARLEARLAFTRFARRMRNPRLAADSPSYKENATLRGPAALQVHFDGVWPAAQDQ